MRLLKQVRLPSLFVSAAISASLLIVFVGWILLDSSFKSLLYVVSIDLGLRSSYGGSLAVEHGWHMLGSRLLVFLTLAGLAIASTAYVGLRLFIGKPNGRPIASLLVTAAVVGGWVGLFVGYDSVSWWGFRFRLWRQLPQFENIASKLAEKLAARRWASSWSWFVLDGFYGP